MNLDQQVSVEVCSYGDPIVAQLVAELQTHYQVIYGGPDSTPVDPAEFTSPAGRFLVLLVDGKPAGCGGVRRNQAAGRATDVEMKRLFIREPFRRRGLSRRLLTELEQAARELGGDRMILETGTLQPEAIALYESAGYYRIPGFGYYCGGELNRCFARDLG